MVSRLYCFLLRLHPRAFRERFSEEMLSIFDESPRKHPLLLDACASLLRQWVLRSGAGDRAAPIAAPVPDGVPVFHTIDHSLPRASVLLPAAVLSFAFFAAVAFAVNRGGTRWSLLIGTQHPIPRPLSVDRNSIAAADPTTRVRVADKPADPWRDFAESYFRIMPVLRALDTDHDFLISRAEIAHAPAALATLDLNRDGKLSAQECGATGPENLFPAFMRSQPVLAALDTDHDGEISAAEIANAPAALRKLDIGGDGALSPVEIAPESVVKRILVH